MNSGEWLKKTRANPRMLGESFSEWTIRIGLVDSSNTNPRSLNPTTFSKYGDDLKVTDERLRQLSESRNVEVKRMALELIELRLTVTSLKIDVERLRRR